MMLDLLNSECEMPIAELFDSECPMLFHSAFNNPTSAFLFNIRNKKTSEIENPKLSLERSEKSEIKRHPK